ncbi:cytochrome c [Coralliovum pocilloporae]|uniref:cytochrome c n=1 Tax=Coralliovum pocilloporae TaxID=3066369 RepID=UPI00330720C6
MMRRLTVSVILLAIAGFAGFWFLTSPQRIDAASLPAHTPDLDNGRLMFDAGGCASCHAPKGAKGDDRLVLTGGHELKTPFGIFRVPNISSDPDHGIGKWTDEEFVTAMVKGVSPENKHYYPAFPFSSYQRMTLPDLLDLKAFMDTLPASDIQNADHDLPFPFSVRRGLGVWKLLFLDGKPFAPDPSQSDIVNRGAYLVSGPAHCGECHTPRNLIGGPIENRHLAGAPAAEGDGFIPNITPHKTGIGSWSESDIVYSLESGFTPEFDSFGGSMVSVQENMARLPAEDRAAIAAYLKSVPALVTEKN